VVAAAVAFPATLRRVRGIRDSKILSSIQRQELIPRIRATAIAIGYGAACVREIDRFNIRVATAIAMRRAIARLRATIGETAHIVIIDGLPLPEVGVPHDALVDGDAHCYTIAAAGILAKEVRDRLMRRLAIRYPGYGWDQNAGYGTAEHRGAMTSLGMTPHHRRSFNPQLGLGL
jgi:ribonuclease HII